ncbi:MAG TPA: hypothetical protein VFU21_03690 [Kofleriaceae bacterium]|nr:hypothetical protein [Kofleriaceae bacterium]
MPTAGRWLLASTAFALALLASACSSDGSLFDPPGDGDGDDDGDGDGGSGPDGEPTAELSVCATGEADHATIGEAIDAAPAGALLSVCPGVYRERLAIEGKPLTIQGADGPDATVLDAGGDGIALTVRATDWVRVAGFTIRGGANRGAGGAIRCEVSGLSLIADVVRDSAARGGGGLYASACDLEVVDSEFLGNRGADRGGGALLVESSGEVSGSRFEGNLAVNGAGLLVLGGTVALRGNQMRDNTAELRGGGLYHESDGPVEDNLLAGNTAGWTGGGVYLIDHAPVLSGNEVRGNRSENDGGGIYVHQGAPTIADCDIVDNWSGDDGGGVRLFESAARLERNRISGNQTGDGGGGVRVSHVAALFVDNVITDNEATMGGGIDMDNDSSVIRGGRIEGNSASRGGGIAATLFPWNGGALEDVRVAGNQADDGGGIFLENNFFPIEIRRVHVVGNTASRGGGLFVRATDVSIHNAVIARNDAGEGGGLYVREPEPWDSPEPCPCPPTDPSIGVAFAVLHQNTADEGSAVWVDTSGLSVSSSILSAHGSPAVVALGPSPAWSYTDTVPASFSGMSNPTGSTGNISADPLFVDTDRFALRAGSPCVNAGDPGFQDRDGTRADMGRFGGPEGSP